MLICSISTEEETIGRLLVIYTIFSCIPFLVNTYLGLRFFYTRGDELTDKEKELETLMNKISATHTTHVDTLLIAQNNETLKLCILIIGGVVLCSTGYYIFTNIFQVFSLKKIIPVSFYTILYKILLHFVKRKVLILTQTKK